jgi:hypothetical protein
MRACWLSIHGVPVNGCQARARSGGSQGFPVMALLLDEPEMLVATRCPGCNVAHTWDVGRETPRPDGKSRIF